MASSAPRLLLIAFWLGCASSLLSDDKAAPAGKAKLIVVEKTTAQLAAAIRPSIVKVIQTGRLGMDGLGAGFIVREDGLIATNKHVIGEARRLQVETSDGKLHEVTEVTASDAHLDLALLRIAQKGLRPLPLGDSDAIEQGDPVVAMGNPEGLEFSVVEGVVSGVRDIEEVPMIQVAVPIERGNSGGPLLDRQGRVIGLLTLKSIVKENLGYAMPSNQLKTLIEKPNPVPMSRWLTIGVLDRKFWKPLFGAEWTQHAGVIKSAMMGGGFGGRTLCLAVAEQPPEKFDAAVTVRLEDEEGAAGLVFCSDGKERHYGFYPTAGKLRLTRFEGPDVFSWTVLSEIETDAYRPGDWNSIRVRVDESRIRCFVNGRQVIEQEDTAFRGGLAGLCKFRAPSAEFRNFRVGADLAEKPIAIDLAANIRQTLGDFLSKSAPKHQAIDKLLGDPSAGRRLIIEQRKEFEQKAAALRELERDLHRQAIGRELVKQLGKPEGQVDLLRCALLVSKHDNPEIDVEQYHRSFRRMVDELAGDSQIKKGAGQAVRRLSRYLFEENGFHGSRHDYESQSNSYINEVLDDREGLPITLSVVYVELAKKLGVKGVFGVPVPSHFMVGYKENGDGELRLIDVFNGGKELKAEDLADLYGDGQLPPDELLQPALPREIVIRMIRNLLSNVADRKDDAGDCMPYLNLILSIDPAASMERLQRAELRGATGDKAGAREDIGWLLEHPPEGVPAEALEGLNRLYRRLEE